MIKDDHNNGDNFNMMTEISIIMRKTMRVMIMMMKLMVTMMKEMMMMMTMIMTVMAMHDGDGSDHDDQS